MELSIILPVYNVEKYVEVCLKSIFRQGIEDDRFEVIIVNDGTEDNSMEVIANIINNHSNITIINKKNQGLPVARNNGLAIAKGEYVLFVDSDDMLIDNSLKPLLNTALEKKVDLAMADYLEICDLNFPTAKKFFISEKNKAIEKSPEQIYTEDLVPCVCYVWRTLYRRDFLNHNSIKFVPGITYEDQPFTHECFLKAKKCIRAQWPIYIYRTCRPSAITSTFDIEKAKDMCISIANSWKLTHLQVTTPKMQRQLHDNIFLHFKTLTLLIAHDIKNSTERHLIIDFLKKQVPELYFNNGLKQRVISFIYRMWPHGYIRLRFWYGKIWEDTLCPIYKKQLSSYITGIKK